jgi:GAF domain-containing protein
MDSKSGASPTARHASPDFAAPGLSRLTRLAARVVDAPIAFLALMQGDQCVLARTYRLPEPLAGDGSLPLPESVVSRSLAKRELLVVEDARQHPELRCELGLHRLGLVALLGLPLHGANGEPAGFLAVADRRPRAWGDDDLDALDDVGTSVMAELELVRARSTLREREVEVHARTAMLHAVVACIDGAVQAEDAGGAVLLNSGGSIGAAPLERAIRGERVHGLERERDGRWQRVDARPLRDREGQVVGAVAVARDVTAVVIDDGSTLPNRRGFLLLGAHHLRRAARAREHVALVVIRVPAEADRDAAGAALAGAMRASDIVAWVDEGALAVLASISAASDEEVLVGRVRGSLGSGAGVCAVVRPVEGGQSLEEMLGSALTRVRVHAARGSDAPPRAET